MRGVSYSLVSHKPIKWQKYLKPPQVNKKWFTLSAFAQFVKVQEMFKGSRVLGQQQKTNVISEELELS